MSFPKAKVKRFNEVDGDGVPPVGAYDPKLVEKSFSVPFTKSTRFKNSDPDLSDTLSESSSARKMSTPNTVFKVPKRSHSFTMADETGRVRQCELEIKRLLNERSSLLKQMTSKDEDVRKVDAKLQAALREKTSLQASLASFERENKELRRMSDILAMKVSTMNSMARKKDISTELLTLKEKLINKEHEISDVRVELTHVRRELEEAILAVVSKNEELVELQKTVAQKVTDAESHLEASKSELRDLQLSYNDLEGSYKSMHGQLQKLMETVSQNEALVAELRSQKSGLLAELSICQKELETRERTSAEVTESLRRENLALLARIDQATVARQRDSRIMSAQLDNAYQKLQSTEDCSRALQEYRDALVGRVATLRETITQLEEQQTSDLNTIKTMKLEILNESSKLAEKDSALLAANSEIISLKEQINELQKLKIEVLQLTAESVNLKSELESCTNDREQFLGECFVIRLQLQAAEHEIADSSSQLLEIKSELFRKNESVDALESALEELKASTLARMTDFTEQTQNLQQEIRAKEGIIDELNGKMDEASAEYASKYEEFDLALVAEVELRMKLTALEAKLEAKESHIAKLSTKLDSRAMEKQFMKVKLETEKAELERSLIAELKAREILEDEATALRRKNDILEENLENLSEKYELGMTEIDVAIECLLSELIARTIESDIDHDELIRAREERDALEAELLFTKDEIAHRAKESAAVAEILEEKKRDLSELQSAVESLKNEAENLKAANTSHVMAVEGLSAEIRKKDEEIALTMHERAALEAKLQVRETSVEELTEKQRTLEEDLRTAETKLEKVNVENEEMRDDLEMKNDEVAKLNETCQDYERRLAGVTVTMRTKVENIVLLTRDIDDLHCTLKGQSAVLLQRDSDIKAAGCQLESVNNEMERMRDRVGELEREKGAFRETIRALEDDLVVAKGNLDSAIESRNELLSSVEIKDDAIANLQSQVAKAGREIVTLELSKAKLAKDMGDVEEKLRCRKDELEAALLMLQQTHANNEHVVNQLRDDLRRLEAAKHDAEMQFLDARNIRKLLHGELRTAQRELQEAEDGLQASEKVRRELEQSVCMLRQSEATKMEELSSAGVRAEQADAVISTQKKDLERVTAEAAVRGAAIEALEREVSRLATTVDEKDGEVAELRVIVENNQQLMVDNSVVNELTAQLTALSEANNKQDDIIEELRKQMRASEETIKQQKSEIGRHAANVEWHCDREKELRNKLEITEEKFKTEQRDLKKSVADAQMKLSVVESEHLVYTEQKEKEGKQNEELLQSLTNEYEKKLKALQEVDWKKLFEDLQTKVEPFLEQLNTYEFERRLLLSKNRETKCDLERLSGQYATLLGHQNHKQKIHHLMKLKDDNLALKEENDKLRAEVLRFRKSTPHHKSLLSGTPRSAAPPAAFDSASKLFKRPSDKENASPLRDRNIF